MNEVNLISSQEISKIFDILSHPIRVSIITVLRNRPMNYTTLQRELENPSTGTLNYHLQKLDPLISKDGDVYKLTNLGEKAYDVIDQYIHERETAENTKVVVENVEYWKNFLDLDQLYAPIILATSFVIIFLIARLLILFGVSYNFSNFAILLFLVPVCRWIWQKIYFSKNPTATAVYMLLNYATTYWIFMFYYLISPAYNWNVIGEANEIRIGDNPSLNIEDNLLSRDFLTSLGEVKLANLDYGLFIIIFLLVPVLGLIWASFNYNELPSFYGKMDQSSVTPTTQIESELKPHQYGLILGSTILSDFLILDLIFIIVRELSISSQILFYYAPLQFLLIVLLISVKFLIMRGYQQLLGYDIQSIGYGSYLHWFVITGIVTQLVLSRFIYQAISNTYDQMIRIGFLSIDVFFIEIMIILLNIFSGLLLFSYFHQSSGVQPIIRKKISAVFTLFFLLFVLGSLKGSIFIADPSPNYFVNQITIIIVLLLISTFGKLFSNPVHKKVVLLTPLCILSLFTLVIDFINSGISSLPTSIIGSISFVGGGYLFSRLFSDVD